MLMAMAAGATWLRMAVDAPPWSPNDPPTTALRDTRVAGKSAFFTQHMQATFCGISHFVSSMQTMTSPRQGQRLKKNRSTQHAYTITTSPLAPLTMGTTTGSLRSPKMPT